jgi:hypothetical protein
MARAFDRFMVDVEVGRNLKLGRLKPAERWVYVAGVLPIAAKSEIRGALMVGTTRATDADVARQADVTPAVARAALKHLRDLGMLEHDRTLGAEWVHDFEVYNPEPKQDKTAAERAKRYRERQAAKRDVTAPSHRDGRDANGVRHGDVTPPEVEGGRRKKEEPPNPPDGGSVKFNGRVVPAERLALAVDLLAEFNRQAGTEYGPFTGDGKLSDSLKRIVGSLTRHPDEPRQRWMNGLTARMRDPFWQGKPGTGVVFGPGVDEQTLANAGPRLQSIPGDVSAALTGLDAMRDPEAAKWAQHAQAPRPSRFDEDGNLILPTGGAA